MTKGEIRQAVRRGMAAMTAEERATLSVAICNHLEKRPEWLEGTSLLLFSPLPDEPDISPLLSRALESGQMVHLPRFNAQTGAYAACRVSTLADLTPGRFGVLEPAPHCLPQPLNQLDFVLVPGVAFDRIGRRVGRGKGFYDRLLAEVRGQKCGVCFDLQVVQQLPEEPHDIRLNSILTPTRWHVCQGAV